MKHFFKKYGLYLAWLVAMIATFCSLYASEILGYKPCFFCWYQRIMMFPLVIILGIAAFKGDKKIIPYVLAFPIIGAFIALTQIYFTYFASADTFCGSQCFEESVKLFGVIDFSIFSFISFVIIFFFLIFARKKH